MRLIKKLIIAFCVQFVHGESLNEFEQGKAYCKNSKGDFLKRKEFVDFISEKKNYIQTNNENLINRYFNTLWFSLVDKFDACEGYENLDKRIKFYSDSILKNDTNSTETLTTFAMLCKILGKDYNSFNFLQNQKKLLNIVNHYYQKWHDNFFNHLKIFKTELAKNTLTYGTAFDIHSKVEILKPEDCEIAIFAEKPLIGISCDDFSLQEEGEDAELIELRINRITSENILVKIFDETKKQESLIKLFITPKGKFTKNTATTSKYFESLTSDDFKDLCGLEIPFDFSGIESFFNWINDYNNMERLLPDNSSLYINMNDEENINDEKQIENHDKKQSQFKKILTERFQRKKIEQK